MTSSDIVRTPAEHLVSQFYKWERRGRGWKVYPHPVRPEPLFEPFFGHFLPAASAVDDGREQTIFSSLADSVLAMFRGKQQVQPFPPSPEEETEPDEFPAQNIVELLIELPKDEHASIASFEQLLVCTGACRQPLSFEILAQCGKVSVQLAVGEQDARQVADLLTSFLPEVVVTAERDRLTDLWRGGDEGSPLVVEFGLSRECMLPLASGQGIDPYVALLSALSQVQGSEVGVLQVMLEPVRHAWANSILRAVTAPDGKPFFDDAPEFLKCARTKIASPLFAAVVRLAVTSDRSRRTLEIARAVTAAMSSYCDLSGNELIPLSNDAYDEEEHVSDLLTRRSRRSGMILNSEELAALVHLPSEDVSETKWPRLSRITKAAPASALGHPLVLGENLHHGRRTTVSMSTDQRMRHMHVIGASGTGKSTFLLNCILQDIHAGHGIGVLDPHGDLIEQIIARIPESRIKDVIFLDPSDEEYAIGFNILSAHSDIEKTLLASDLVGIFKRFSTSWGDQMGSVLSNAVLAFLESKKGGTLSDLRRFLIEPAFRKEFLTTVTDDHVLYYWSKEFPLLSGRPQAPLLTRLDTFLRPKPVRYMVSQPTNKLHFADMMDSGKIFLAKLSQGAIGEENAFLLGSLLVSKFHQLTLGRQSQSESSRRPFFLYCDEFGGYVTPSMAKLLSGARKFRLGLILSHQDLQQLHDADVESALLHNAGIRVCFRLGHKDAKELAEGFASFTAEELRNLGTGEALCRILKAEDDCNIKTSNMTEVAPDVAAEKRKQIVAHTRATYATERKIIEAVAARDRGEPPEKLSTPPVDKVEEVVATKTTADVVVPVPVEITQEGEQVEPVVIPPPVQVPKKKKPKPLPAEVAPMGKGGQKHKYFQHLIAECGQQRGWRATIEMAVKDGSVDVVLERDNRRIAFEISCTTTVEMEVGNLRKCLAAGFTEILMVCNETKTLSALRKTVEKSFPVEVRKLVKILSPEEVLADEQLLAEAALPAEQVVRGYKVKVRREQVGSAETEARRKAIAELLTKKIGT